MGVKEFLTGTNGHLCEKQVEGKATSMLAVADFGQLDLIILIKLVDGQIGQIQQVAYPHVKLFVQYLLIMFLVVLV